MKQREVALAFSLLVLLTLTLLGVTAVTSSVLQLQMSSVTANRALAFGAAEAAIAGVLFESEDSLVLTDPLLTDPFTEARQMTAIDLATQSLSCFDDANWVSRRVTQAGLVAGALHTNAGAYTADPEIHSWSKTAYVGTGSCLGSSNVIAAGRLQCQLFVIRGCGQLSNSKFAVANTLMAAVIAPTAGYTQTTSRYSTSAGE